MDNFVMTQLIASGCKRYLKNFERIGKDEFMKLTLRDILRILDIIGNKTLMDADFEAAERILARKNELLGSYGGPSSSILSKFRFSEPKPHGLTDIKEDDCISSTSSRSKHSKFDNHSSVSVMGEHQSNVSSYSVMSDRLVSELRYFIRQETQNFITNDRLTAATNNISDRISQNKASINQLDQIAASLTRTRYQQLAIMNAQNQPDAQQPAMMTPFIDDLPYPWSRLRQASRYAAPKYKRTSRYRWYRRH